MYVRAYSISDYNMHNAFTEGVDLQYSIQCQLTKPADKLQYCIMRKDTVVERDVVNKMY